MEHDCKCFTFIWKVRNFDFCWQETNDNRIHSPLFCLHSLQKDLWRLELSTRFIDQKEISVVCCLQLISDNPSLLALKVNLSFLDSDGSSLISKDILEDDLRNSEAFRKSGFEICYRKKTEFVPQNFLFIRCQIWGVEGSITQEEQYFVETEINRQKCTYVLNIKEFSNLVSDSRNSQVFISSPRSIPFIRFDLWIDEKETIYIEIMSHNFDNVKTGICCFYFMATTKYFRCGQLKFVTDNTIGLRAWKGSLDITRTDLLKNKELYLPNDVLSLHCDIFFSTGTISEKIEKSMYRYNLSEMTKLKTYYTKDVIDMIFDEKPPELLSVLKKNLQSLYEDSLFSDMKLRTDSETFPVHKNILSARSPVFKAMLTTDMTEMCNNCIDIIDLDADTVRRMLQYMYSETLDNLEYENAKNLYFASDKYEILSLKQKCSFFLKNNLQLSNCCDVLVLADMHQDENLKSPVEDFIARNAAKVIDSEEWINLEKNHPLLAAVTLRKLYSENIRK